MLAFAFGLVLSAMLFIKLGFIGGSVQRIWDL
jgi:hypothetical protein